jgi:hypothetical protein
MSLSSFVCKKCNYIWTPRKAVTRYRRQCPKCNNYEIDAHSDVSKSQNNQIITPAVTSTASTAKTNLPSVIFDLIGISGACSAENAICKASELYRRLYLYKVKYNLENEEEVFAFLEKETLAAHKKANEADARLQGILANPENVFFEIGGDLDAPKWYEALKKTGYDKSFLDFLNQAVNGYWENKGYELAVREKAEPT